MPTWPTSKAGTTHLDSGSDNPGSARADILQNVTNVNSMIDTIVVNSPTATQVLAYDSGDSRFENVAINTIAATTGTANTYTKQQVFGMATATYVLIVKQDGTGSRTLSYGSEYKFPGGTAPTLSTGANDVDVLCFVSDGTNLYGSALLDFS